MQYWAQAVTLSVFLSLSLCMTKETHAAPNSELELDPVLVQAPTKSAFVHPSLLAGKHTRLNSQDYVASLIDLERILNQQQGIQIRRLGGLGQFSYPSMRGATGKQIQIFWDGLPLTSLNDGSASLPAVGLSSLSHIDIYQSTLPVELGATAIGGALHLISKESPKDSGELSAGLGTYGAKTLGGFISQRYQRWQLLAGLDGLQADNDFTFIQTRNSFSNPNQATQEKRRNNAAQQGLGLLRINYQASQALTLSALWQQLYFLRELSSFNNHPDNQAYLRNHKQHLSLKAHYNQGNKQLNLWLMRGTGKQLYDDSQSKIGLGAQRILYASQGSQAHIDVQHHFAMLSALFSANLQQERIDSHDTRLTQSQSTATCYSTGNCPQQYQRQQATLGTRLQWQLTPAIILSIQGNHIWLKDSNQSSYGFAKTQQTTQHNTGDIGLNLNLTQAHRLSVLYAMQLRPVATYERFGDRGMTVGNPNLQAETAKGITLSLFSEFRAVNTQLSLYQRTRHNAITGEADSRGVIRYNNTALTLHQGLEAGIQLQLSANIKIKANSGYHLQRIKEADLHSIIGNFTPNQRRFDSFYELTYRPNNWQAGLSYLRQTGGFYDAFNLLPIAVKEQINAQLGYRWQHASLMLDLLNLNNNRTSDFAYYPAMGRQAYIKFRYQFY